MAGCTPNCYRKTLIPLGTHHAPEGIITITPDRIKRYIDQFKEMKSRGVRIPVPWGHRISAVPFDPKTEDPFDDPEYQAALDDWRTSTSKWNSGYVEDFEVNPETGALDMIATIPPGYQVCPLTGDLINPVDNTRIGEVSAGIANWPDGRGKQWEDVIIHAAITPLPVWAGQSGFQKIDDIEPIVNLSAGLPTSFKYLFTLSTQTSGGRKMADKKKDEAYKPNVEVDEAPIEEEEIIENDEPEPEFAPPPSPEKPELPPSMNSDDVDFNETVSLLREMGMELPPDMNKKDGWKTLRVALFALRGTGMKFCKPGDGGMNGDQSAVPPATDELAPPPGATPENMPIMMSTIREPFARKTLEREQKRLREDYVATWEKAKSLGCPVSIANREAAKASRINLALNGKTGDPITPNAMRSARLVVEVLQAANGGGSAELLATLSAQPLPNPIHATPNPKIVDPEIAAALRDGAASNPPTRKVS